MTSPEQLYKYEIPLDTSGGVKTPVYEVPTDGYVYKVHYTAENVVLVKDSSSPHFHRDSVNVDVEKVQKSEYTE